MKKLMPRLTRAFLVIFLAAAFHAPAWAAETASRSHTNLADVTAGGKCLASEAAATLATAGAGVLTALAVLHIGVQSGLDILSGNQPGRVNHRSSLSSFNALYRDATGGLYKEAVAPYSWCGKARAIALESHRKELPPQGAVSTAAPQEEKSVSSSGN